MKFWLTLALGVVAVAGVSTALMVMSPSAVVTAPTAEIDKADPDTEVVAVVEGPTEYDHRNVGQHQQGQDIFKIRNASKTQPLILEPMKPTCQCTALFIADREVPESEPYTGPEHAPARVEPGKVGYVIARWDTKNKLAEQRVGVPVRTNDPRNRQITFTIRLDVQKEIMASSEVMNFGPLNEGTKTERSVILSSLIRDKIEVIGKQFNDKHFDVRIEPLTPDELKQMNVKSGLRILGATKGNNPVGSFMERLMLNIKTSTSKEVVGIMMTGAIMGDIMCDPSETILDFKEVTKLTHKPITRRVFARNLKDGESLKLGSAKPDNTVQVTFERKNPKLKMWELKVSVKPTANPGKIEDGVISIVDQTGRERLIFRVVGMVDPDFTRGHGIEAASVR